MVTVHNCWCLYIMCGRFVRVCCNREGQIVNTCSAKVFGPSVQHLRDTARAQHYSLQIFPQDLCHFTLTTTLEPSTDKPEHTSWQVSLLHMEYMRAQTNKHTISPTKNTSMHLCTWECTSKPLRNTYAQYTQSFFCNRPLLLTSAIHANWHILHCKKVKTTLSLTLQI